MNPILLLTTFVCRTPDNILPSYRTLLIAMLIGLLTAGFSSCATTRGLGQDVETVGEKIEDAASR